MIVQCVIHIFIYLNKSILSIHSASFNLHRSIINTVHITDHYNKYDLTKRSHNESL